MTTYLITSAFCKSKLLEQCLQSTEVPATMEHIIVDNHYPIDKEENQFKIKLLAQVHGCHYLDSGKDLGLHEGFNNAVEKFDIGPDDLVIGLDPDDRPSPGALHALEYHLREDAGLAVLGLAFSVIYERFKTILGFDNQTYHKETVWIHPNVEMWNVAAYNMELIHSMGGFKETFAYYGGLESALYGAWSKKGMNLGYLPGYTSEYTPVDRADLTLFDPEYRLWKNDHVAEKFRGSFEEWLKYNNRLQ